MIKLSVHYLIMNYHLINLLLKLNYLIYSDVSRTPVREAINELVLEQLMIFKPRKGYKVNTFTNHEIDQIFLLRESLEIACVPFIVQIIDEDHIHDLKAIIEKQIKSSSK